ncbi:SUF system NifU family Fe-S cluster assembly protein [bacterium]|nr:SUF system NifU family Fe-S cluster assembly protein [bacterium]
MSRLESLYQELILDHNKSPRNFGKLDPFTHYSHGINPLCGDDYEVTLTVSDDVVVDAQFTGSGCAISKASGSLMTLAIIGQPVTTIIRLKNLFLKMLLTDTLTHDERQQLGKLAVLEGVKKFPARVKCAALVWRAIEDALSPSATATVSTE